MKKLTKESACLFISYCNLVYELYGSFVYKYVWKSKCLFNGTIREPNWFVGGIGKDKGKAVMFYLPADYWYELKVPELPCAFPYDDPESVEVVSRFVEYYF